MKDERNWYIDPPRTKEEFEAMRVSDTKDLVRVAVAYFEVHRCKMCGHRGKVRGYICTICGGDDTQL